MFFSFSNNIVSQMDKRVIASVYETHQIKLNAKKHYLCICIYIYTILPKVLGHPLQMKGLTTLVISMSTNLNVLAYNDILGNCVLLIS